MNEHTADPITGRVDVVAGFTEFAAAARRAGMRVGPARTISGVEGLSHLDPFDVLDVYWAGRLTMCGSKDDLTRYDEAFAQHFGHTEQMRGAASGGLVAGPMNAASMSHHRDDSSADEDDSGDDEVGAGASNAEVLRMKDFTALSDHERAELHELIKLLEVNPSCRRSMRTRPAARGRIDVGRSLQAMARHHGELTQPARRSKSKVRRRTVFILDVSGSMSPYADALLRFAHAATRVAPNDTEVFTAGTRLNRVTAALRHHDPDQALVDCFAQINDWEGGTRLGDSLAHFVSGYGRAGMARRATVVIASDGWERGDASLLGDQLAALRLLAHKILWIHPYQGKKGFVPATNGMTAALPHLDALIAGHSLQSLETAAEMIANA